MAAVALESVSLTLSLWRECTMTWMPGYCRASHPCIHTHSYTHPHQFTTHYEVGNLCRLNQVRWSYEAVMLPTSPNTLHRFPQYWVSVNTVYCSHLPKAFRSKTKLCTFQMMTCDIHVLIVRKSKNMDGMDSINISGIILTFPSFECQLRNLIQVESFMCNLAQT